MFFFSNCAKPEYLKAQKESLVLSLATPKLRHKLINTALSGLLPQSIADLELFKERSKSYQNPILNTWQVSEVIFKLPDTHVS